MHIRFANTLFLTTLLILALVVPSVVAQPASGGNSQQNYNEWTVARLEAAMANGNLTSEKLTKFYIQRILDLDQSGPGVNAVIELNPDAIDIAKQMDQLRKKGTIFGPMHGIPVLVKDNVDTF